MSKIATLLATLFALAAASYAQKPATDISHAEAGRFLLQASFGPTEESIDEVRRLGYERWITDQFVRGLNPLTKELTLLTPVVERVQPVNGFARQRVYQDWFWDGAINADDQLRMRMVLALSQIIPLEQPALDQHPGAYARYVDALYEEGLGNYCNLVRRVSVNPQMGHFLTFINNKRTAPGKSNAPDENYARELMQLFTIGLENLKIDGTSTGQPTYTDEDVAGLAAVFTGFTMANSRFRAKMRANNAFKDLVGYPAQHEQGPKVFLGTTIPGGLKPEESMKRALDHLLAHPNVAPFISKQLIQKLVTSNPSSGYIKRVAQAFDQGEFKLPSGRTVGSGQRCDMKATAAAILLDPEARRAEVAANPDFGKLRSPILRLTHIFRVVGEPVPVKRGEMPNAYYTIRKFSDTSQQQPFRPPSVFSFYRPGFVPAGGDVATSGLVAPEMQIFTSESIVRFAHLVVSELSDDWKRRVVKTYRQELLDASAQPKQLVAELEKTLAPDGLDEETKRRIVSALRELPIKHTFNQKNERTRLAVAVMMISTTDEFLVQK